MHRDYVFDNGFYRVEAEMELANQDQRFADQLESDLIAKRDQACAFYDAAFCTSANDRTIFADISNAVDQRIAPNVVGLERRQARNRESQARHDRDAQEESRRY